MNKQTVDAYLSCPSSLPKGDRKIRREGIWIANHSGDLSRKAKAMIVKAYESGFRDGRDDANTKQAVSKLMQVIR